MRRDAFQAIADPTRREILGMIAHKGLNVNSIAENFDVSRTAIYKHIKILTECGLLVVNQEGRERYCEAKLEKLDEVFDWLQQHMKGKKKKKKKKTPGKNDLPGTGKTYRDSRCFRNKP